MKNNSANQDPLTQREKVSHLLSRLAFGARVGDVEKVLETGINAWLDDQLQDRAANNSELRSRLSEFDTLSLSVAECTEYIAPRARRSEQNEEERKDAQRMRRVPMLELMQSVALRAVLSDRQATEVMVDFWRNHFNVSFTKGQEIFSQINDYEREVIRDNTWNNFPTMLSASATHPAMLTYLDNHLSRRPLSEQELDAIERRTKRKTGSKTQAAEAVSLATQRGLNENYARELLELHTLGADNYYTQDDVIAVAKVLTGWTIDGGRKGSHEYKFDSSMHVSGDFRVLGKKIKADKTGDNGQGREVLEMLGAHKGTAQFVAMKLVRYLVSDVPDQNLVNSVAKIYRKTNGDMVAMIRAIVESDMFFARENYRSKFKTPFEFIVSALRVTSAEITSLRNLESYLKDMGQPILHCDDPTGYYDVAEAWLDPGVMALRWEFATDLVNGKIRGIKVPDKFYQQVPSDCAPQLWQHYLTKMIIPGGAAEKTRSALAITTSEYLDKTKRPSLAKAAPILVGLLLGSPEFQQQ
ncbi:MAG: DUF1800 domain-containing protein [Planctomycetes bacterium]|nr:DUF1800 domain-containing protein [Planctomycetota bacterium]